MLRIAKNNLMYEGDQLIYVVRAKNRVLASANVLMFKCKPLLYVSPYTLVWVDRESGWYDYLRKYDMEEI